MTLQTETTLEASFLTLRRIFRPENSKHIDAEIQFILTGEGGAEFFATIRDQSIHFTVGNSPSPKVKMRMPAADFLAMLDGTVSTTEAFTSGKMKVGGNLIYAMKLATVFAFGSSQPPAQSSNG